MTSPKSNLHPVPDQQQPAPLEQAARELAVLEQAMAQATELDPTLTQILSALVSRTQALNAVAQTLPGLRDKLAAAQAPTAGGAEG